MDKKYIYQVMTTDRAEPGRRTQYKHWGTYDDDEKAKAVAEGLKEHRGLSTKVDKFQLNPAF